MNKTLYVIDFDRTLVDYEEVMRLVEEACEEVNVDFSIVQEAQIKAKEEAVPYSPLKTINALGPGRLEAFKAKFIELADPQTLVFDDARRYLDKLNSKNKTYLILTYAIESHWQEIKIEAAKLQNIPHIITFNEHKAREISGWYKNTVFIPPLTGMPPAEKVVFIDDKIGVFGGMPEHSEGYLLDRFDFEVDSPMPTRVERIISFDEIIDKI